MKLFKKLAAVALAAVLALSMVGCGAAVDIKSEINDYITDISVLYDMGITHKDELDTVAQKLLVAANAASETEEKKDDSLYELLQDEEVQAAAGITNAVVYYCSYEENYNFKSELLNSSKVENMVNNLMEDSFNLASGYYVSYIDSDIEYGIAVGKVSGQEYVLMLKVPTK